MIKKLPFVLLFISAVSFSQGVAVNTTTYTPQQLVTEVMMSSECATVSNIILSAGNNCGLGYFNANGSNFPFAEGLVLRNGNVIYTAGSFTDANNSTVCSNLGDPELQLVSNSSGGSGTIVDVTSLKFDIIPQSNILSFNFIFSSNEYGFYQCAFGDVFAFILTDLTTGIKTNLAVIPGTSTPISTLTIRDNAYNGNCPSVNPAYFGQYNIQNPSAISMRGQTVPMTAIATVIPNHAYSLKLAIGDYNDNTFDSAVFIEGGSFAISNQCRDNIQMQAFVDGNANGVKDDGESLFPHGKFTHQVNNAGDIVEQVSSTGTVILYPENISDTYDLNYAVDDQYAPYYTASGIFADITIADGSGTNIFYFPVVNTAAFSDAAVSLIPMSQPRPTMTYKNKISFANNGVSPVSGTITFQNDTATTISEISQSGTIAIPGGFTYDFADLLPNETRTIDVTLLVSADATIGQLLTNTVSMATVGSDIEPTNNSSILAQETVNSFDPNDKTESHGGKIVVADFDDDDYLEYTIHFQNIGTANAINIRIEDTLDAKLDETTLQMLDASHDYVLDRIGTGLNWRFDGINLVGQLQSETLSQGYVHFRIKPKSGYAAGDIIPNTAGIFFDTNPAVITNVVQTEFVDQLGIHSFNGNAIRIYPNPAHNTVTVSANSDLSQVRITDMLGKTVIHQKVSGQETAIDISPLQKGVYFVEVMAADQKTIVRKLVID